MSGAATCIPLPLPQLPTVPSPFSVLPPKIPSVTVGGNICCQSASFTTPPIPLPIPAIAINPAIIAAIRTANAAIRAYRDKIAISCKRQP